MNKVTAAERINLPAAVLRLVVNYIVIYNFGGSATDVIHPSNPLHLIICFEFFGYTLTLCHQFYEPKKHILSLLIYIGKVAVQFAFQNELVVKKFLMLFEVGESFPAPYSYWLIFCFRELQVRDIIIPDECVADYCFFVDNVLFHFC